LNMCTAAEQASARRVRLPRSMKCVTREEFRKRDERRISIHETSSVTSQRTTGRRCPTRRDARCRRWRGELDYATGGELERCAVVCRRGARHSMSRQARGRVRSTMDSAFMREDRRYVYGAVRNGVSYARHAVSLAANAMLSLMSFRHRSGSGRLSRPRRSASARISPRVARVPPLKRERMERWCCASRKTSQSLNG